MCSGVLPMTSVLTIIEFGFDFKRVKTTYEQKCFLKDLKITKVSNMSKCSNDIFFIFLFDTNLKHHKGGHKMLSVKLG